MDFHKFRSKSAIVLALATAAVFSACDSGSSSSGAAGGTASTLPNPPVTPPAKNFTTDVLIFTGDGTWSTEIADAETLLTSHAATYQEATSAQLDAMSAQDMAQFGVIFIPGGEGGTEAESVSATTHANLRTAVQQLGVSYVGFCAGAFVAVAPAPAAGQDVSYGFGVVNGALLNEYAGPGTNQDYEQTLNTFASGSTENILWYGGPIVPNSGVIAKYPTGDPSINEQWSGNGLVILAGLHPDLSQATLDALGVSPDTPATDTAWQIFNAAINRQPITPTF
jgi:glutamine amidotransferase-like uncharacterized protein